MRRARVPQKQGMRKMRKVKMPAFSNGKGGSTYEIRYDKNATKRRCRRRRNNTPCCLRDLLAASPLYGEGHVSTVVMPTAACNQRLITVVTQSNAGCLLLLCHRPIRSRTRYAGRRQTAARHARQRSIHATRNAAYASCRVSTTLCGMLRCGFACHATYSGRRHHAALARVAQERYVAAR